MKKLFIAVAMVATSCNSRTPNMQAHLDENAQVIKYGECEYLVVKAPFGDYGWMMSHKGDCKNPIHFYK